jgi:hypothetical protein
MRHGSHFSPVAGFGPAADRIARLSAEFLDADAARREEIGREIVALVDGSVVPLARVTAPRAP